VVSSTTHSTLIQCKQNNLPPKLIKIHLFINLTNLKRLGLVSFEKRKFCAKPMRKPTKCVLPESSVVKLLMSR